jgi:hypothetical protein
VSPFTDAGRYTLDNGNAGSKPFITEPMEADVLDAFETGAILLSALGFPLFEPVAGKPRTEIEQITYYCTGPDAKGVGRIVEDGFVILNGSTARAESVTSAQKYMTNKRLALISSGVLAQMVLPRSDSPRIIYVILRVVRQCWC